MKTITQASYGPAPEDVLRLRDAARPAIGDGEVLVRVRAASVDRGTWHAMAGLPYPARLALGLRKPKDRNPGRNLAGTIEAVGASVTDFKPGDQVFGIGTASFAEYASARPGKLAPLPGTMSFAQAAAVPVSGLTALQAVRDHARVRAGQRVLVIGASGGVGSFATQIAKAFGAEVIGACRTAKVEAVRALGADKVIDYARQDIAGDGDRYDVILDTGGNRPLEQLRRALTPRGTLVIVGAESAEPWLGGMSRQIRAQVLSPLASQKLGTFLASENSKDLRAMSDLIGSGKVTSVIDRSYPLAEVPAAIRYLLDGRACGKVVIDI